MVLEKIYEFSRQNDGVKSAISKVVVDEIMLKKSFNLTVTILGEKAKCSQPSVSRFMKNLEITSYKVFVRQLNYELSNYVLGSNPKDKTIEETKQKIVRGVEETLKNFNEESIDKIAQQIIDAQKINVVGMGGNRTIKAEIEHKLSQLGKQVMLAHDWHQQLINLNYMKPEDLVIVISYSGDKKESNQIANEAYQKKIPIILFSGDFPSKLLKKATYYVPIKASDPKYRSFSFAAKPAVIAAWEVIFHEMLKRNEISEEIINAWSWKKEW